MHTIKFSHNYFKMPAAYQDSILAQVVVFEESEISDSFREYDTSYKYSPLCKIGHYPLPKGKVLLLLLIANRGAGWLWSTIRRWTPEKERYYKDNIGVVFKCEINKGDK